MTRAYSKKLKDQQRKQNYQNAKLTDKTKEKDAARAIVKDLSHRDPVTGEVTFDPKLKGNIHTALLSGKYRVEVETVISPHVKPRTEKFWLDIDCDVADLVLDREEGEVLNRAVEPCWWR